VGKKLCNGTVLTDIDKRKLIEGSASFPKMQELPKVSGARRVI
jgi:hypothetical protein